MNSQLTMFPETEEYKPTIIVIDLFPMWTSCAICGEDSMIASGGYDLPMYEGKVVNPDIHEWGGFPVCPKCYREHEYKIRLDVFGVPRDVPL